jgi:hypothetical protein
MTIQDQICTAGNDDGPSIVQCSERLDGSLPKWTTNSCEDVPIPSEGDTSNDVSSDEVDDDEEEESSAAKIVQCLLLSAIVSMAFI